MRAASIGLLVVLLAACTHEEVRSVKRPPAAPIETESGAFAAALRTNTADAYASFLAAYPAGDYTEIATELYTEASVRGRSAAAPSVQSAEAALTAVRSTPARAETQTSTPPPQPALERPLSLHDAAAITAGAGARPPY